MTDDLYRRLEVHPSARPEVISAAYRVLAKAFHPDIVGLDSTAEMAALNAAYEVLRDPERRLLYDKSQVVATVKARATNVYMSFGKYKGEHISVVPTDYLHWCMENIENENWLFDIAQELVRRGVAL